MCYFPPPPPPLRFRLAFEGREQHLRTRCSRCSTEPSLYYIMAYFWVRMIETISINTKVYDISYYEVSREPVNYVRIVYIAYGEGRAR